MIAMDIWTTFGVPTLVYGKHIECGCKTITSLSLQNSKDKGLLGGIHTSQLLITVHRSLW
jgi:hypothetical protein